LSGSYSARMKTTQVNLTAAQTCLAGLSDSIVKCIALSDRESLIEILAISRLLTEVKRRVIHVVALNQQKGDRLNGAVLPTVVL
jgi:hypothetical protein